MNLKLGFLDKKKHIIENLNKNQLVITSVRVVGTACPANNAGAKHEDRVD